MAQSHPRNDEWRFYHDIGELHGQMEIEQRISGRLSTIFAHVIGMLDGQFVAATTLELIFESGYLCKAEDHAGERRLV